METKFKEKTAHPADTHKKKRLAHVRHPEFLTANKLKRNQIIVHLICRFMMHLALRAARGFDNKITCLVAIRAAEEHTDNSRKQMATNIRI